MVKKIIQAVGLGFLGAILIVAFFPQFKMASFSFSKEIASYHEAVQIASPAVVNVYNRSFNHTLGESQDILQVNELGSGVIMSGNGYVLTNKHVIQHADQIIVTLQNGTLFNATLIGVDSLTDLAVLKIQANGLPTIPQNTNRPIRVGDVVLAIGNPFNLGQSITQGIISATGRNALSEGGRQNFIQIDASINKGNSGGALINSAGELIGINTLSLGKNNDDFAEGLNFAIPITLANKIMEKIIKDGRVIRGYLGIKTELLTSSQQIGLENGLLITNIDPTGPAAKAGIQTQDLILTVDGVKADSSIKMMETIANMPPKSLVEVVISRQGEVIPFRVEISEYPDSE